MAWPTAVPGATATAVGYAAGPFVQVQLTRSDNQQGIEAALTRERHRERGLKPAEEVFVKLKNARAFADHYSIGEAVRCQWSVVRSG